MNKLWYCSLIGIFLLAVGCGGDTTGPNDDKWELPGTVMVHSQAELDTLAGLTAVNGILSIGDLDTPNDIHDLSPLSSLRRVSSLAVRNTSELRDLRGLENLSDVGWGIHIYENSGLKSLEGLGISELEDSPFGELKIYRNDSLSTLTGLESLERVNVLSISECPLLTDLSAIAGIDSVGSLGIGSCPGIADLEDIPDVANMVRLSINNLAGLQNLEGLESLSSVNTLIIEENPGLSSFTGLEGLQSCQSLHVIGNPALADITALGGLNGIDSYLSIKGNDTLLDLDGLESCRDMVFVNIVAAPDFDLSALAGLETLTTLRLTGLSMNAPTTLIGLTSLGGLNMESCTGETLGLPPALAEFGTLALSGCNELLDLSGFSVPPVIEFISIYRCESLTSLVGCEAITDLGYGLMLTENPLLASLAGLTNLERAGYGTYGMSNVIIIQENPSLSQCEATDFVEALDLYGDWEVSDNGDCP